MKLMLLDDVSLSDGPLGHLNVLSLSSPPPPFLSLQLGFDLDREVYPLVVHAVVDEGDGNGRSLSSFALRAALLWFTGRAVAVASGTTRPLRGDQAAGFHAPCTP